VRRGKADTRFPMAPPRNLHEAWSSLTRSSSSRTWSGPTALPTSRRCVSPATTTPRLPRSKRASARGT
jgi:hypothetical protein